MHKKHFTTKSKSLPRKAPSYDSKLPTVFQMNVSMKKYFKLKDARIEWAKELSKRRKILEWRDSILKQYLVSWNQKSQIRYSLNSRARMQTEIFVYEIAPFFKKGINGLVLFGKIWAQSRFISAQIIVENVTKTLYFVPKRNEKLDSVRREVSKHFHKIKGSVSFSTEVKKYIFEFNLEYR